MGAAYDAPILNWRDRRLNFDSDGALSFDNAGAIRIDQSGVFLSTAPGRQNYNPLRRTRLVEFAEDLFKSRKGRPEPLSAFAAMQDARLFPSVEYIGMPYDHILWGSILRSASAFEMYRKRHGQIAPDRIIEFLILDNEFPRAIHHCVIMAEMSLRNISGTMRGHFTNVAEKTLGRLLADLDYTQLDEIKEMGLHEFIDDLQTRLNQIGAAVHETFFAIPVAPAAVPAPVEVAE